MNYIFYNLYCLHPVVCYNVFLFGHQHNNCFQTKPVQYHCTNLVLFQCLLCVSIHVWIIIRQFLKYITCYWIVPVWIHIKIIFKNRWLLYLIITHVGILILQLTLELKLLKLVFVSHWYDVSFCDACHILQCCTNTAFQNLTKGLKFYNAVPTQLYRTLSKDSILSLF
jgi:hypothetical protein